jgi:hypothetical protein
MGDQRVIDLPTTIEKRELLYGKGTPAGELKELAGRYLEAGHLEEAAEFLRRAGDEAGLERLAERAMAEGDWFAFRQLRGLLGRQPSREECLSLASKAREQGLTLFAERAEAAAGTGR